MGSPNENAAERGMGIWNWMDKYSRRATLSDQDWTLGDRENNNWYFKFVKPLKIKTRRISLKIMKQATITISVYLSLELCLYDCASTCEHHRIWDQSTFTYFARPSAQLVNAIPTKISGKHTWLAEYFCSLHSQTTQLRKYISRQPNLFWLNQKITNS